MTRALYRGIMLTGAVLCLALGIIGAFLPGLPTTVFILLAAWFASQSSPRLLAWLETHHVFGNMIRNWRNGGCVSRRAKWSASLMMAACALVMIIIPHPRWITVGAIGTMAAVLAWLWCRPEPAPVTSPREKPAD